MLDDLGFPVAVYRSEGAHPPSTRPLPTTSCQHKKDYQITVNFQIKNHPKPAPKRNKLPQKKLHPKIFCFPTRLEALPPHSASGTTRW
jgi:hypothetical protein